MAEEPTLKSTQALRKVFKDSEKELRKRLREAERAWAIIHGLLYRVEFTFASMRMTKSASSLLGKKLSEIGTALAFKAELRTLEMGKTKIDRKTMKGVLDEIEASSEGAL